METYLQTRPTSFPTLPSAIEWHIRSRTLRNTYSARVSVPPLLSPSSSSSSPTPTPTPTQYTWHTSLSRTSPYWPSWFASLSTKFLNTPGPSAKLLVLAGTDRLDKPLTIGQMQGKFQLAIVPEAGHFVHEDQPAKTAMIVADFYRRSDRVGLVLPKKVGEGGYGLGKMG